jgi:hypothetical protein
MSITNEPSRDDSPIKPKKMKHNPMLSAKTGPYENILPSDTIRILNNKDAWMKASDAEIKEITEHIQTATGFHIKNIQPLGLFSSKDDGAVFGVMVSLHTGGTAQIVFYPDNFCAQCFFFKCF